jgi:hypothetical protein
LRVEIGRESVPITDRRKVRAARRGTERGIHTIIRERLERTPRSVNRARFGTGSGSAIQRGQAGRAKPDAAKRPRQEQPERAVRGRLAEQALRNRHELPRIALERGTGELVVMSTRRFCACSGHGHLFQSWSIDTRHARARQIGDSRTKWLDLAGCV